MTTIQQSVTFSFLTLQASAPQRVFWDAEEERSKCWREENLQPQRSPQRLALHTGRVAIQFLSFPTTVTLPICRYLWGLTLHFRDDWLLLVFHLIVVSLVLNWLVLLWEQCRLWPGVIEAQCWFCLALNCFVLDVSCDNDTVFTKSAHNNVVSGKRLLFFNASLYLKHFRFLSCGSDVV